MSPILCKFSKHSLYIINLALRNCLPEHGAKPAASCVVLPNAVDLRIMLFEGLVNFAD